MASLNGNKNKNITFKTLHNQWQCLISTNISPCSTSFKTIFSASSILYLTSILYMSNTKLSLWHCRLKTNMPIRVFNKRLYFRHILPHRSKFSIGIQLEFLYFFSNKIDLTCPMTPLSTRTHIHIEREV